MRHRLATALLLLAAPLSGCGPALPEPPPSTADAPKPGPHGGTALALPEGAGYVEVINEPTPQDRSRGATTAIVAYFLAADLQAAVAAAPANVKVVDRTSRTSIALKPEAKAGDPAGAGRFASAVGAYNLAEIHGELSGTIAGKPFSFDLGGIR